MRLWKFEVKNFKGIEQASFEWCDLVILIGENNVGKSSILQRELLRQLVRNYRSDLIAFEPPEWVPNPGGGGNWKSNANSILPQFILVPAVRNASDEAVSKEGSAYGKIMSLIIGNRLIERPEVIDLRERWKKVLHLFQPDPENPDSQAQEIREIQRQINAGLNRVVPGFVSIETAEPDVPRMFLPNTELVLQDRNDGIKTPVEHQGHGLQRTLIMTLLQLLAETQGGERPVVLGIEEPELYLHPQMERKMRDTLYQLASRPNIQVACTTHSPVFPDIARDQRQIVRLTKDQERQVSLFQATEELFSSTTERQKFRILTIVNQTFAEVFFANHIVLLEEASAIAAFRRAADSTGIFERHPQVRYEVTLVDTDGKGNIPLYQQVLNHFEIPYLVVHDKDQGNEGKTGEPKNKEIEDLLRQDHRDNHREMIGPTNLEGLLGITENTPGRNKTGKAIHQVEKLFQSKSLPAEFMRLLNRVYFGRDTEPS